MSLHGFHPELLPLPARIVGERVVITPMARGDGAAIYAAVDENRSHLRPWLPWVDHHQSVDDSEAFARRAAGMWLTREDMIVALRDREGRFLGGSGLHRIDWERRAFEIGYWIRESATGRGIVTEAVRLLTVVCFDRLDASRVEIRCDPDNGKSSAIPERLGYVREALFRSHSRGTDGTMRDTLVFALTPPSYESLEWMPSARAVVAAADGDG